MDKGPSTKLINHLLNGFKSSSVNLRLHPTVDHLGVKPIANVYNSVSINEINH